MWIACRPTWLLTVALAHCALGQESFMPAPRALIEDANGGVGRRFSAVHSVLNPQSSVLPSTQERQAPPLPQPVDNAALYYWKAAALLPQPSSPEELRALQFIEGDLQQLPPEAIAGDENARVLLEREQESLWALRTGADKPHCNFDLAYQEGPYLILNHLAQMRRLARHALAAAKLYQLNGDQMEAAATCGDLLRLAAHLDQDNILISGLVGAAIVKLTLSEIEGLLSREPSADAVRLLLTQLNELPQPVFHPDRYVRLEAHLFGDWMLQHLDDPEEIAQAFGAQDAPLPPSLEGLNEEQIQERAAGWLRDYQQKMDQLADALAAPYPEGKARLQEIMHQVGEDVARANAGEGNPFIATLMPALDRVQDVFTGVQAQLGMARIACVAVLFQAEHGAYPTRLEHLGELFPAGVPQDPFTGETYTYRLEDGLPYVACDAPQEVRERNPDDFHLGLAERRAADEAALTEAER